MHPSILLVCVCLGFLIGASLGGVALSLHPGLEILMGLSMLGLLIIPRCSHFFIIACIFVLALGIGVWRMESVLIRPNAFEKFQNQKWEFEGIVVESDRRPDNLLVNVRPDGFGRLVQLRLPKSASLRYGDLVIVEGKLTFAKSSSDFDYAKFLAARGIDAQMYYPKVLALESGRGNFFLQKLDNLKAWMIARSKESLQLPARGLVLGVLVGDRQNLDASTSELFLTAGLTHILVASGYNLTVMAGGAALLFGWLGRRRVPYFAALAVLGFVGLAGASASVVRAGIMALVVILARMWGRNYSPAPSLLLAASLMVALSPRLLLWDAGFQLSFAATAGILFFVPVIEKYLDKILPGWIGVSGYLSTSLAAILATLPLILYHFGRLSLVALPANLLVVPFVPALMFVGSLVFVPGLTLIGALLSEWLSAYMVFAAGLLSRFPYAMVEAEITLWGLALMYVILFALYLFLNRREPVSVLEENNTVD